MGAAAVPEEVAPNAKLRPHSIIVSCEIPEGGAEGVLLAEGGRFGVSASGYVRAWC